MGYQIYTTEGLVIRQLPIKEADSWLLALTKDWGLIMILAVGLRRPAAKMRGHARPFIYSRLSLIKGRLGWRLIGAQSLGLTENLLADRSITAGLDRLSGLLDRLLIKEVRQSAIFDDLISVLTLLKTDQTINWSDIEVILVTRWLHYLGYLPDHPVLRPYLSLSAWTAKYINQLEFRPQAAITMINRSLRASGL